MTLDEFEYLVRTGVLRDGREVCCHMVGGNRVVGVVSKLARQGQKVVGVEVLLGLPDMDPDSGQMALFSEPNAVVERVKVIAEPPPEAELVGSVIYVPASVTVHVEWVAE